MTSACINIGWAVLAVLAALGLGVEIGGWLIGTAKRDE